MKVGEMITLPCGATITLGYLERARERSRGLVSIEIVSKNGLKASDNEKLTDVRCVPAVELGFWPENIDALILTLQDIKRTLERQE